MYSYRVRRTLYSNTWRNVQLKPSTMMYWKILNFLLLFNYVYTQFSLLAFTCGYVCNIYEMYLLGVIITAVVVLCCKYIYKVNCIYTIVILSSHNISIHTFYYTSAQQHNAMPYINLENILPFRIIRNIYIYLIMNVALCGLPWKF